MANKFSKIAKRDGSVVKFNQAKITEAIFRALTATKKGSRSLAKALSDQVVALLSRRLKKEALPNVEDIQNLVEEILISNHLFETARAYILYREQHRKIREIKKAAENSIGMIEQYLNEIDWRVRENSNMSYSLQGLNNYIAASTTREYWLNRIYPPEIRQAYLDGDFHIHNLDILAAYCAGWDLYDLLLQGFGGVLAKIESKPARHFRTALGQIVNFIYTLQGEVAGAQALSSFDTLLAPFIRYDRLSYGEVKQNMQEFLFNINVPTRVGFQTPFSNLTFDLIPMAGLGDQPVLIGGQPQKETYKEFQPEIDMINQAFAEIMMEGDAKGRVFTFPIPTYNITKDFDWNSPLLKSIFEMTAKYGTPYFSNFINSDMKPEDVRSMCCRLRLSNKELYKRGGSLFGSYPLTGSIGVVTVNLPRLAYLSKTKKEFLNRLDDIMDLARQSLEIKRKVLENFTDKNLYPYAKYYLAGIKQMRGSYWANHFSTIGLIGMNEALLNFIGKPISHSSAKKLAIEILEHMRERLIKYQNEDGGLYNLEATPAEGASYSLAKKDKEKYPEIITAGEKEPYYTNSTHLPVDYSDDLFGALDHQDELQALYTGGTVLHGFLGERLVDGEQVKGLLKKIFTKFRLPYFTFTPTFSVCPQHGYLSGEHFHCPKCTIQQPCEVYSRVVGYLRPVQQWHKGKQEEFRQREEYKKY